MTEIATINQPPAEVPAPASGMISMLERVIMSPDVPLDRIEKMLEMQERIIDREAKAEHAAAKALAMADMPTIPMTGTSEAFRRKGAPGRYSTLRDITSVTRPVLARHGLTLSFDVRVEGSTIGVTAKLAHANGYEETTFLSLPFDASGSKNAVQAIGSSQTYAQRYTAQAILGLSLGDDTDDDGAASNAAAITTEQLEGLRAKIAKAGADEEKLCSYFKVARLENLPQAKYGTADALLTQKMEKANA